MIDVLLIYPQNIFRVPVGSNIPYEKKVKRMGLFPPNGVLYIASSLKRAGISTEIIDCVAAGYSLDKIISIIDTKRPKIVGISSATHQIRGAVQIAGLIRERYARNIVIGIGGAHTSSYNGFIERFPVFDFALAGEGEVTFPKICKDILKNKKLGQKLFVGESSNINHFDFPDRDLIDQTLYYSEPYSHYIANIHSTRGCPFRCIYCSNAVSKNVRYMSPERVVEEMELCIDKYNVKYISFTDDTFTLKRDRVKGICDLIIRNGIKIDWSCTTRADLVDKELLALMYKSGCRGISYGVETGDEKVRHKVLNKKVTDNDIISAFAMSHQSGMKTCAFCMIGHPGETKEDMLRILPLVKRLKPYMFSLFITEILPGSSLFERAVNEKKITSNIWDDYANGNLEKPPVYLPDNMNPEDLENIRRYIFSQYYFNKDYILSQLKYGMTSYRQLKWNLQQGFMLGKYIAKGLSKKTKSIRMTQ